MRASPTAPDSPREPDCTPFSTRARPISIASSFRSVQRTVQSQPRARDKFRNRSGISAPPHPKSTSEIRREPAPGMRSATASMMASAAAVARFRCRKNRYSLLSTKRLGEASSMLSCSVDRWRSSGNSTAVAPYRNPPQAAPCHGTKASAHIMAE